MQIGITGSYRKKDRVAWGLEEDFATFKDACRQIGQAIARTGSSLTVGSDSDFTADKYAVEGYLSERTCKRCIRIVRPSKGPRPFPDLRSKNPESFVFVTGPSSTWRHTRYLFVSDVDALVTVGGARGTYQAALELGLTRKRLVPVGAFGGASARLLAELRDAGALRNRPSFETLGNPWTPTLANDVVKVLGADRPSRVLLIHGHANDRIALTGWLRHNKLADPLIMGQEFTAGQTLPEKFEELAGDADAAIALATPDDLAASSADVGTARVRARQNVWVEVGWFCGRLGHSRVLLLVRGDVEIPSDLDGIELSRYRRSVLVQKNKTKIQTFLRTVAKRNQ